MPEQLEMTYAATPVPNPGIADLEEYLKGKGWKSALEIEAATGWSDRKVRDLASESDLIISSPGRKGYKHLADVTSDEYLNYRNGRRSQVRLMLAKVIRTDRIFYRRPSASIA